MGRWGGKATTEMSKFDLIFTFGLFAAIWHLRDTPVIPDLKVFVLLYEHRIMCEEGETVGQ